MKPLKQAVREHLQQQELSARQLATLMAMQQPDTAQPSNPLLAWAWPAVAAAAVMLAAVALWRVAPITDASNMPQLIAEEVADNHLHLKPLEVVTNDIDTLRDYFDQLDFMPIESQLVADAGLQMMGGRYCSIQGITAAQIRVHQPGSEQPQTVYQTVYDPAVFKQLPRLEDGEPPIDVYVKGLKVRVWVEKGVLFAMTVAETSGP